MGSKGVHIRGNTSKLALISGIVIVALVVLALTLPEEKGKSNQAAPSGDTIERAIPGLTISAFVQSSDEDFVTLRIRNYDERDVEILGIVDEMRSLEEGVDAIRMVKGVSSSKSEAVELRLPKGGTRIAYRFAGTDPIYYESYLNWPEPEGLSPRQRLILQAKNDTIPFARIKDSLVIFPAGVHDVTKDIVILADQVLKVEVGCTLRFEPGADLISFGSVLCEGHSSNPILFEGKVKGAGSVNVLNAGGSHFSHTKFSKLGALQQDGWNLTGAVTIHETSVGFWNCEFADNLSEDGLNCIRSEIEIKSSSLSGAFSDGLDTDFCTGRIEDCHFRNTGNDGMDLSGSQIWIVDCTVKNAGDKGLSLGEQSTVGVHKLSISNSFMGIASKDKSEVKVTESEVSGCKVALTAYQKKAEFGPASLEFQGQLSDNETDHLIERGSKLNLNGEHIVGN